MDLESPVDVERSTTLPCESFTSGVRRAVVAAPYEYMTLVASDARSLLGALMANLEWMKSTVEAVAAGGLVDAVDDMEICLARLNNVLERLLIGTRGGGLAPQRSEVSVGAVVTRALGHVSKIAQAKRVRIRTGPDWDIVAMLDRTLLTCGLASLMSQVISSCEPDGEVVALCEAEKGQVAITFRCVAGPKPTQSEAVWLPSNGLSSTPTAADLDVEFCRLVAEWHGGQLMVDTETASYRVVLPWVGAQAR